MPRLHDTVRACARRAWPSNAWRRLAYLIVIIASIFPALPSHAHAESARFPVQLTLPTPPGEPWRVLQGYACGSHNSWDRYSLDIVSAEGRTAGAPVRAAADGVIYVWARKSGTLILDHGDGFYTMYTHMQSAASTEIGRFIPRGAVIGAVGDRGAPGTPHLHFTAFVAEGAWARNRRSVPLSFVDGFNLPEIGGCNQHGGARLTAAGVAAAEGLAFSTAAELGRWYNRDVPIEFGGKAAARGFSFSWGSDPAGDSPSIAGAGVGVVSLAATGEGLHTLYVRAWAADGTQTLASFGPIGYDVTPPQAVPLPEPLGAPAQQPAALQWPAASDNGSGVAGYRIYIGPDPAGTSEWFVPAPQVQAPPLAPGNYVLRVQPLDYAGNVGEWTTLGAIVVG